MDNKKTGEFICNLRKEKNLTQKELANILGITDKAVSKWERGAGYPDISMLNPLADALGTSINELLDGESATNSSDTNTKNIDNVLDYAYKIIKNKNYKLEKLIAAIFTVCLCIAILTCVIVNIAVDLSLTWSILVIAGCIMGGCLLIPPVLWKKRGIYISLFLLTILIIPFLAVIEYEVAILSGYNGWLWNLAFPISITWLIFLWLMVLAKKLKINIWFYMCIGALLCVPCDLFTNYTVDHFLYTHTPLSQQVSNISTAICFVVVSVIFFVIGLMRNNKS